MKKLLGIALILAMIFAFAACGSNATDDSQNNGDSTTELLAERYAFEEGGFSIQPPKGWDAKDIGQTYIAFMDMDHTDFSPNINFVVEEYKESLKDYVAANTASLKKALDSLKIVEQSDFTTLSGQEGTKLVVTNEQLNLKLQQTFYIFELSKSKKIVVTCTNLADNASDTDVLFEESASTFKVDK